MKRPKFRELDLPGDDLWRHEEPGILIRVAKVGEQERLIRADPEQLQVVMDKAAKQFFDPTRPATKPAPEPARFPSSSWASPRRKRTSGSS